MASAQFFYKTINPWLMPASLTVAETRYANIERELLAVTFGVEGFHTYIYDKPFVVEIDHKPLEIISLKNLKAAPPRLLAMLLRLQGNDMKKKYHPRPEMVLPDGLSRNSNIGKKKAINLNTKINLIQFSTEKLTHLQAATAENPITIQLTDAIINDWPARQRQVPNELKPYWPYRDEVSVENGIILKGDCIVMPKPWMPYKGSVQVIKAPQSARIGREPVSFG